MDIREDGLRRSLAYPQVLRHQKKEPFFDSKKEVNFDINKLKQEMLSIVESKRQIRNYQHSLKSSFENYNPEYIDVILGSAGGAFEAEIMYFKEFDFWAFFGESDNRYWNAFGVKKPNKGKNTSIGCEINFPYEGIDRRIGGAFVKEDSEVIVLHRGKIGGGRKGIGKKLFRRNFIGKYLTVSDGDKENELAIVGNLNSKNLIQQFSVFVYEVDRVKKFEPSEIENDDSDEDEDTSEITSTFSAEGYGIKKYARADEIEAICNHGIIVNQLAKVLAEKGYEVGNDNKRDLFTKRNGKIDRIFEVKTDLTNSSIYSAIGQILMYSAEKNLLDNKKILVLPQRLKQAVEENIKKIGLSILYFDFEDEIKFINIEKIL